MSPLKKTAATSPARKVSPKAVPGASRKASVDKAAPSPPKPVAKAARKPSEGLKAPAPSINAAGVGIYIALGGKYAYVNSRYEQMTGFRGEELIGSKLMDYISAEDRASVRKNIRKSLKASHPEPYEYRFWGKKGEPLWFLETSGSTVFRNEQGFMGSVINVTRLKQGCEPPGLKEEQCSAALREMEEHYYEQDLQGNFIFVNEEMVRTLGYSREELTGMNYRKCCSAGTVRLLNRRYTLLQKTGHPFSALEAIFLARDGSKRIFEVSGALIPDAQGRPAGFRGVCRNITGRKLVEEELRKSEERYRSVLDATDEGFCELDLQGNITFINMAGAKILGDAPKAIVGKNFRQYMEKSTEAAVLDVFKNIYKTRQPMKRLTAPILHRDGEIRFLEISGSVLCNVAGKPTGFRGMYYDITERKKAEEALQQSEAKYFSIIENIGVAYFETDLKGTMTFVNDQTCQELGYTREELIGRMSARHFQTPGNAKKTFEVFHQVFQTGVPVEAYHMETVCKDGSVQFFELSILLHRDEKNTPVGFRGLARNVTQRKKMESDLRRSEERYRTILEEIEEGYAELDLDGNWTFVNETAGKILGYRPEEMLGENLRSNTDEDTARGWLDLYERLLQTGQSFKGAEIELTTKQGNRRMTEISGALIRDEHGQSAGFRSLIRDVTERKWSEDALLQSEARYFSIIESIGDAYFETDLRGVMTFVNDRTCLDLGYTRDEFLRMSIRDCQTSENAQKTYEVFTRVYETGTPVKNYALEASRKDGSVITFEMFVSLMRNSLGQPIGFRCLSRDITERKKMEDALRASEERARTIITTIPDPYFENDLRGKFTFVNAAFKQFSGYTDSEIKNASFKVFVDQSFVDELFSLYNSVYTTGLPLKNVEIQAVLKSGERRLVNLSVSLIRDNQGNPTGFSGIIRDITEKKKAEEMILQSEKSLREYSETLEMRVRERTAELEKSKIAAEEASRAKSDFLAHISHEFQTPLNAVVGFTKVLQDRMFGEINDKQEEFLRYIADAGANLSRIIAEIVDVAQVKSGRIKLQVAPVVIAEVLSRTTRLLASQIEDKKQLLTVDVDLDADTSIEGDVQKIQQIFFNLLNNAVKYTGEGGTIQIHVARTLHATSRREGISIAFKDTGSGIRAADMSKLFEAFGTLQSAYTRSEKGIGVGLSLTKQLVELHGGDISVESEFGKGSCFTVFLPLKQKQEQTIK